MKQYDESTGRARARHAFTLVEVMVSTALAIVIVTLVMGVVVTQSKAAISIGNYADMNESGRKAMTKFQSDMRLTRKLNEITATTVDSNVVISSDVAGIVGNMPTTRTVYYYVNAARTQLWRESPKGSNKTLIMDNLAACRFLYFDKNDTLVTDMTRTADVRKILMAATMRRSFTGITTSDYLVSAVVTMRCRSNR